MRAGPIALILASLSPAAQAQTSAQPPSHEVVVTGHRLDDTAAALKACLARHCPPDEDASASLEHAENQIVAGAYADARQTLLQSLGRNRRYKKQYPVAVADLWRAESRTSLHLGEADDFRLGAIESLDALRAGLPADDPRILAQRIEVADAFIHLGRLEAGMEMYRDNEGRARAIGRPDLAALIKLKRAAAYTALSSVQSDYRSTARQAIGQLAKVEGPGLEPYRRAADLLSAELSVKAGDVAAVDKLVAASRFEAADRPVLLYSPPIIQVVNDRAFRGGDVIAQMATENYDDQWADVSFWVKPDGRVADPDILRGSKALDRYWLKPVLAAIAARRYAPLKLAANDPGLLRVERYTRTAHLVTSTGSRLRVREAFPRIEMLDLTAEGSATLPSPKG